MVIGDVVGRYVRLRAQPVSDSPARHIWNHGLDVRIVETKHRGAVKRDLIHKVRKAAAHIFHVVVIIHVLAIDIGHHGDHRRQHEKRSIALIRFDDHQLALTEPRIRMIAAHDSANHKRWIEPGGSQHCGDHRSRGGLAMRTGAGDRVRLHAHKLGKHLSARNYRNRPATRFDDFRIVLTYCGGTNYDVSIAHVCRIMTFGYFHL